MNLESLKCFHAAATQLHFRRAAAQVFLSPTAFSARIQQLEDTVGTKLFERSTRQVRLTLAGTRLAAQVQRVFAEVDRCVAAVTGTELTPFTLRLGTRFELGLSWLTPALSALKVACPERSLSLVFGDSDDLLRRLFEGRLDAVVTSLRLTQPGLEYAALHDEHYVLVGHRTQALRRPADLSGTTLLDTQPDLPLFRYLRDATTSHHDWRFAGYEYLGSIAAVRYRVLENAGIAVLPRYFVRDDLAKGRLRQLLPRMPLRHDTFRLVWQRADPRATHYQQLANELRARPLT